MPTPPVPTPERQRRQALMDRLVNEEGFAPLGSGRSDVRTSAPQHAKKQDGVNYARWIRDEEKAFHRGEPSFLPSWFRPALDGGTPIRLPEPDIEEASAEGHASARARDLQRAVRELITGTRYPVINPECILVDRHMVRSYSRKLGDYVLRESAPRTWLSGTPRVAGVAAPAGRKFIFTGAQNDAPLHAAFWTNLQALARHDECEIVVGPLTYETTWWSEHNPTARSYAVGLREYLCFGQMELGDHFVFCGEMNTLPTASNPVSDLVTYPRNRWAVFPHAKRQLKSVPSTDPAVQAHQVMTTGLVTVPKVIPRKAGVKSLFHAVLGAVLVEFDHEGNPFCRQITATEDGTFYDLDRRVSDGVVTTGHRVRALVCGDAHLRKLDQGNALATFGTLPGVNATYAGSMLEVLQPEHVMLHDVFDNESRNHHHVGDNGYSLEMWERGRDSVRSEVYDVAAFLEHLDDPSRRTVVVESNHDLALERFVREARYRNDGPNIRYGLELDRQYLAFRSRAGEALDRGERPEKFSLLETAVRGMEPEIPNTVWAYDGHSFLVDGIECGHHGFRGANGAKGTISGYARMGRKMTVGDKHSPEINEGVYCAGAMNLSHGYNRGPSSWAVSHVVQYADGARAIITLQQGRWRAEKPRVRVKA